MITRRFLLALLATVALLGAACSSSGDETATADDAGSDSSESTTEDDTSTGDEPAETTSTTSTTTTTTSTTTTTTTTTTTVPAIDPFLVDSYCTFSVNFDARAEQVNIFDPDEVRMWLLGTQGEIQRFVDVAPAEIRDDIALQAESFDEFVAIIEANDWNLLDSAEEVDALETPEADAAADRLDDWEDEVCADGDYEIAGGIGDGTDEPDAPPSFEEALASPEAIAALLETDIGRQLFIEGMTEDGSVTVEEAECFLDNLDPSLFAGLAAIGSGDTANIDPELVVAVFDIFVICGVEF